MSYIVQPVILDPIGASKNKFYLVTSYKNRLHIIDGGKCRSTYKTVDFALNHEDVFPIGSVELESETFQAPKNIVAVLTSIYGCIEEGASYNEITGKYEKRNSTEEISL